MQPDYILALNNRANLRLARKDFAGAIADCNRVMACNETEVVAYFNRAVAHFALGDLPAGMADLDRAITIDPTYAKAIAYRGKHRASAGDALGAMADFDRAIASNPDFWQAHAQKGVALANQQKTAEALDALYRGYRLCRETHGQSQIADLIRKLGGTVPE